MVQSKYVDNSKRRLRLYQSTVMSKRTEQNLFVRIVKSEAEVTNNKTNNALEVFILLKLTADRQSSGLSAIAEFLVFRSFLLLSRDRHNIHC